ncbi:MAG TPA: hypothetical protein VE783_02560, partial [Candidatus Limnocylindrales bacterium]|nr:hypothetical protein [Candidatus Limnocylindrales bacterium]
RINDSWNVSAAGDFTRGEGFHSYDNVQSGFMLSYVRPLRRTMGDGPGAVGVDYPLRFSIGVQQQSFYNFPGDVRTSSFRPVAQISLF